MLSRLKFATMPQYEPPHDPILSAILVFGYAFPDLFESLDWVSVLENRESPVSVRIVHMLIVFLRPLADVNSVAIQLEHIKQEGQVVVSVRMGRFQLNHLFEVVLCRFVKLQFEVAQA